jgi:hypothetical protein
MSRAIVHEGKDGKGLSLRELCIFCGSRFRSLKQRTKHTKFCKESTKTAEQHSKTYKQMAPSSN